MCRRSECAAKWTPDFCVRVLSAAEQALKKARGEVHHWSVAAETKGTQWEAVPVTSSGLPDESLREQLSQQAMTGSRYDYILMGKPPSSPGD